MILRIKSYILSASGLMTVANFIVAASNYVLLLFILQLHNQSLFSQWQAVASFIGIVLSIIGGLGSYISKSVAQLESPQEKYEFQQSWKNRFRKWLTPLLFISLVISVASLVLLKICDVYTATLIGVFLVAEMFFYFNYHFLLGQELGKSSATTLLIYNTTRVLISIVGILVAASSVWLPIGFIGGIILAYVYSQNIISKQFNNIAQHPNSSKTSLGIKDLQSIFTTSLGLFILTLLLNGFVLGFYSHNTQYERVEWSIYVFIGSLVHFAVAATLSLFIVESAKYKSSMRAIQTALIMGILSLAAVVLIGILWPWIAFLHHNQAQVAVWWMFGLMICLYNIVYILLQYLIGIKKYALIQKLSFLIVIGMIIWYISDLSRDIMSTVYTMTALILSIISIILYSLIRHK